MSENIGSNQKQNKKDNEFKSYLFAALFAMIALFLVFIGSYYVYAYVLRAVPVAAAMEELTNREKTSSIDPSLILLMLVVERYLPLLLITLFAFSFTRVSISFVRSAQYNTAGVVPPGDVGFVIQAIKDGKPEPIDQYIRLASLTGGVGLFQKIGLTGLPLTTLGLVIFFAIGVLLTSSSGDTFKAFLDFTKLTLGAFIGSFVQRQVERRGQESDIQRAIQTVTQGQQSTAPPPSKPVGGGTPLTPTT